MKGSVPLLVAGLRLLTSGLKCIEHIRDILYRAQPSSLQQFQIMVYRRYPLSSARQAAPASDVFPAAIAVVFPRSGI